jgi:transposase-like protein
VEQQVQRRQRPGGRSWRLDETDVKRKGKWAFLDRAVDKAGPPIDLLLTLPRERDAAEACLRTAIRPQGLPEQSPLDPSGSNTAASMPYNPVYKTALVLRPANSLTTLVEHDQRAVNCVTQPRLDCNSVWVAWGTRGGMERSSPSVPVKWLGSRRGTSAG